MEEIFDAALDAIARALGTDRASVLLFDAEGVMRFRAWRNLSDPYRAAVEGHSPWPAGARDPQPIVSGDVETDPAMASYLPLFRTEQIGALAFIPLVGDGRLIGKFMVYYTRPRELTAQELELARAIANHVAAAVLRFRSLAELQQTVHLNETFAGILGHDLRNPLAAIITSARLAMKRAENDRLQKPLSRILSSGDRMTRMIDQLLDFTRVRLGGGIPHRTDRARSPPGGPPGDRRAGRSQSRLDAPLDQPGRYARAAGTRTGCRSCSRTWWPTPSSMVSRTAGVAVTVDGRAADSVRVAVHNRGVIPADRLPIAVRADGRAADGEVYRSRAGPLHHPRAGPRPRWINRRPLGRIDRNDVHRGAPPPVPERGREQVRRYVASDAVRHANSAPAGT